MSSPDLYLVPGAGLQSHHTATCGAHIAILAVGVVFCEEQQVTIDEEVAEVILPALHRGPHAVAKSPGSRHRHSEDA